MDILFAFSCLMFSALNDFVFKLFARKNRSRGTFVGLIGVVWLLMLIWLPWGENSDLATTLLWGTVSGIFSATANLLLIEAMGYESAGVCSTIYRLNLVLVVVGAWLLLEETLNLVQMIGVSFAVAAVLAFFPTGRKIAMFSRGFYLVSAAAMLRAGMGLAYRYGFLHGADRNGVIVINALFWIAGGILYAVLCEKSFRFPDRKILLYSIVSGVFVAGIIIFMALALQYGKASIVLPIAQMSFLGTFGLSILFLKEPVTCRNTVAIVCGIIAIILLTV